LKITQEVADKVQEFVDELNRSRTTEQYYPDEGYDMTYFSKREHELDDPWISINFGHGSINVDVAIKLKKMFPEAVIYFSGGDYGQTISLHEITYTEADKRQMEYNHRQEAKQQ